MFKYLLLGGGIFCLWMTKAVISGNGQETYTFRSLEKRVLEQDYHVSAFKERQQAAKNRLSSVWAEAGPEMSTFYRYSSDRILLDEVDVRATNLLTVRLTQDLTKIIQTKWGRVQSAKAELGIGKLEFYDAQRKALLKFRRNFIDVLESRIHTLYYVKLNNAYQSLLKIHQKRYQHQEMLWPNVLLVEKELIRLKGLQEYYQKQLSHQKIILADFFQLEQEKIIWDELKLVHLKLEREALLNIAFKNSSTMKIQQARAKADFGRASDALYENIHLLPYVGLRWRGDDLKGIHPAFEMGFRFSFPLLFGKIGHEKYQHYKAKGKAWKLEHQGYRLVLKNLLLSKYNQYLLLNSQIKNTAKIIQLTKEKSRIAYLKNKSSLSKVEVDPVTLLEIKIDLLKTELRHRLHQYERDKLYFEVLYLAGFSWPEDLQREVAKQKIDASGNSQQRAMWLWKTEKILVNEDAIRELIRFCKRKGITQICFSFNKKVINSPNLYAKIPQFITRFHQSDIFVSALLGEPQWIYPKYRPNLLKRIGLILNYNSSQQHPAAQFDAIHLDLEPHSLPAWDDNKRVLLQHLAKTLQAVKQEMQASSLALEIDIPPFYHKIDGNLLKQIIDAANTIFIMAYKRTNSSKMLAVLKSIIYSCNKMNKAFVVGVNAADFKTDTKLDILIREVEKKVSVEKLFQGFSIHDYHGYQDLQRKRR